MPGKTLHPLSGLMGTQDHLFGLHLLFQVKVRFGFDLVRGGEVDAHALARQGHGHVRRLVGPVDGPHGTDRASLFAALRVISLQLRVLLVEALVLRRTGPETSIPRKNLRPFVEPLHLPLDTALGSLQGPRVRLGLSQQEKRSGPACQVAQDEQARAPIPSGKNRGRQAPEKAPAGPAWPETAPPRKRRPFSPLPICRRRRRRALPRPGRPGPTRQDRPEQ